MIKINLPEGPLYRYDRARETVLDLALLVDLDAEAYGPVKVVHVIPGEESWGVRSGVIVALYVTSLAIPEAVEELGREPEFYNLVAEIRRRAKLEWVGACWRGETDESLVQELQSFLDYRFSPRDYPTPYCYAWRRVDLEDLTPVECGVAVLDGFTVDVRGCGTREEAYRVGAALAELIRSEADCIVEGLDEAAAMLWEVIQ